MNFLHMLREKNYNYFNNDFLLGLKFKLRDFRSSILGLNFGNRKFKYFYKDKVLRDFEILKSLNPKYKNLKINFLKRYNSN